MNTKNSTEYGIGGNRKHKDTLFRKIFGTEENKEYLLSLYNAINGTTYTSTDEMVFMTMEDVLFISMKNDVAFLFDAAMNLYEHQSSINNNMPIRGFMYMAKLWQKWISQNQENIYKKSLVKIPTPSYVVFYNGTEKMPDKSYLYLSEAFRSHPKEGNYEFTAIVYNINAGKNKALMEKCKALREYSDFIRMVRENYQEYQDEKQAIIEAIKEAISLNYLDGYFEKERDEVFMTTLFEVDRDIYERDLREEGRLEGREEGRKEGRIQGRLEGQKEGRMEGQKEGREEGIFAMINLLLEMDMSYSVIVDKVEKNFMLSTENAKMYVDKKLKK